MAEWIIGLGVLIAPVVIGWPLVHGLFAALHLATTGHRGLAWRSGLLTAGWAVLSVLTAGFFFIVGMAHCCRDQVVATLLITMGAFAAAAFGTSRLHTRWLRASRGGADWPQPSPSGGDGWDRRRSGWNQTDDDQARS